MKTTLEQQGIFPTYFTGFFAREVSKTGCQIYVSCLDEDHIDEVKPQLRKFLDKQTLDNNDPTWDNIA
jgi:hypothetical protein